MRALNFHTVSPTILGRVQFRRFVVLATAAGCLAGTLLTWLYAGKRIGVAPPNSGLTIAPQYLDFGRVWESSNLSLKLPVENTSSQSVQVIDMARSCTCVSLSPRAFTIAPSEICEITAVLDLTTSPFEQNSLQKQVSVSIVPKTKNGWALQKGWTITGQVKKLLSVGPERLFLPDEIIRGQPSKSSAVKVSSAIPLNALEAHCDPKMAKIAVKGGPKDFQLEISPEFSLAPGFFQFKIGLKPQASGEVLPEKTMSVEGYVHQQVEAFPSKIALGALRIGAAEMRTVDLVIRNTKSFHVLSWATTGKDVTVASVDLKESQRTSATFKVVQAVSELGERKSTITFVVNTDDGTIIEVPCSLTYYGLAPER